jgi:hypothetical protein
MFCRLRFVQELGGLREHPDEGKLLVDVTYTHFPLLKCQLAGYPEKKTRLRRLFRPATFPRAGTPSGPASLASLCLRDEVNLARRGDRAKYFNDFSVISALIREASLHGFFKRNLD